MHRHASRAYDSGNPPFAFRVCDKDTNQKTAVAMAMFSRALALLSVLVAVATVHGWSTPSRSQGLSLRRSNSLLLKDRILSSAGSATTIGSSLRVASSASASTAKATAASPSLSDQDQQIRKEGGLFAFKTKYGALNPFGIYYGLTSILLGIPWYIALTFMQLVFLITGGRFDKQVRWCFTFLAFAYLSKAFVLMLHHVARGSPTAKDPNLH